MTSFSPEVLAEAFRTIPYANTLANDFDLNCNYQVLAAFDKDILGIVVLDNPRDDFRVQHQGLNLRLISVSTNCRRQKVASKLMEWLMRECAAKKLQLTASTYTEAGAKLKPYIYKLAKQYNVLYDDEDLQLIAKTKESLGRDLLASEIENLRYPRL